MHRRFIVSLLLVSLGVGIGASVWAQVNPDGWTTYQVNMRAGPDARQPVIITLNAGTDLIFEARTADLGWMLAHTLDGARRGWVSALYVGYAEGFGSPAHLPVSDEIMAAPAAVPAAPGGEPGAPEESGDPGADIDAATAQWLASVPVVPTIGGRVAEIFQRGQALGNNARVFTQVGECNSMSQAFMVPFGAGKYNLGLYNYLQSTIDYFWATPAASASNSFWYKGVAMTTGLTALAVIDPSFSNPALCPAGQSLLECEYERSKPSIALINLGLYDVYWLTPDQYEYAMRRIIEISIERGVIPVLTTFPTHPGDMTDWPNDSVTRNQNRALFNRTVVNLANEYGVPVMNLWQAAQSVYWNGLRLNDYQHLSEPPDFFVSFNGDEFRYGFTMWNLAALQTLDAVVKSVGGVTVENVIAAIARDRASYDEVCGGATFSRGEPLLQGTRPRPYKNRLRID